MKAQQILNFQKDQRFHKSKYHRPTLWVLAHVFVRVLDEFRSLRWGPLQPKHLDYENTQLILIGHKDSLGSATVPQGQDQKENKDDPKAEMEKLEHEDEIRVEHLKGMTLLFLTFMISVLTNGCLGDDAVYEDLTTSAKDYPKLQTTW